MSISNGLKRFAKRRNIALAGAALLGAAALVVRSKTRKVERSHPPIGQFIEVNGVRLHYFERGQGQPLVLLHGNGAMAEDFDISGLVDTAAREYRVIVIDRPGFGHSERPRDRTWTPVAQAELLYQALRQLDVEEAIVLGHSWGTLPAIALALEHPSFVRGLVLLSGYYFPTLRLDVPFAAQPAIPLLGDVMRYTVSPLLSRLIWPALVRRLFGPARTPERFAAFPVWITLRPGQIRASAAESGLMIPAAMALRKRYRELAMPVGVVAGADDRIANIRRQSRRLHEELPRSEFHVAEGVGHMVHYSAQEQVIAAIGAVEKAAGTAPSATVRQAGSAAARQMH
jgi:pimeloyl-ACP methyl ester carboxylesterase